MKKIILITAFLFGGFMAGKTEAQVSVNVNIGHQPVWGPIGYDYVEYYYMPDIEVYYWVPRRQFVYFSGGRWLFASSLPVAYRSYNLYSGYKVVVNEPRAYLYFNQHKVKYKSYKGNYGKQTIIRSSNDPKYYVVKGHPKYTGKSVNPGQSKSSHGQGKSSQEQGKSNTGKGKSNQGKGNKKG